MTDKKDKKKKAVSLKTIAEDLSQIAGEFPDECCHSVELAKNLVKQACALVTEETT